MGTSMYEDEGGARVKVGGRGRPRIEPEDRKEYVTIRLSKKEIETLKLAATLEDESASWQEMLRNAGLREALSQLSDEHRWNVRLPLNPGVQYLGNVDIISVLKMALTKKVTVKYPVLTEKDGSVVFNEWNFTGEQIVKTTIFSRSIYLEFHESTDCPSALINNISKLMITMNRAGEIAAEIECADHVNFEAELRAENSLEEAEETLGKLYRKEPIKYKPSGVKYHYSYNGSSYSSD